ncbi:MAG: Ig-like domain-containing protein, partial [Planctomycetaceae bacterium]|nr:Ig-like domain-containing protein [Planctomycetaceae bacterium]
MNHQTSDRPAHSINKQPRSSLSRAEAAVLELTTLEPMVLLSASSFEFAQMDLSGLSDTLEIDAVSPLSSEGTTLFGTDGADSLVSGALADVVFAESGDDWVSAGDGDDSVFGGDGDDEILGGAGNDYLDGETGSDIIDGGMGDDIIVLSHGHDLIQGGAGLDLVELYDAGRTVEIDLTTGQVSGGLSASLAGVEAVLGSDQNDVFRFSAPQAGDVFYLHGGAGQDLIDLTAFGAGQVVQNGGHIQATVAGGTVDIYFAGVEDIAEGAGMHSAGVVDFWSLPQEYRRLFDGYAEEIGPAPEDVNPTLVDGVAVLDNYGPQAEDDWASVAEDQTVRIDVLSNDADLDRDELTVSAIVAEPSSGSVRINADGTLDYTPFSDFNGLDELTYEVSDGKGGFDTAVVTINVTPVNDAPQAVNDVYRVDADRSLTVAGGLLTNDRDPDGDALRVVRVGDSSGIVQGESRTISVEGGGRVTVNADGSMVFDPAGGFNTLPAGVTQDVVFEYEITDGHGLNSAAQVRVTVVGTNQTPLTEGEHWWVEYNQPSRVLGGVLFNDSDPDGDALHVASVNGDAGQVDPGDGSRTFNLPEGGRLQVTADGVVTFDPAGDFDHLHGEERQDVTFWYEVSDGRGGTATETATISVVGKNQAPTTEGEHWWVEYNQPSRVLGGVLFNDSDPDGDALHVASVNGDAGQVDPGDG